MNVDALVAPLRADVVSGASVVARTAAEVVRRTAVRLPAESAREFREELGGVAIKILDAQPAMAPLVALTASVLEVAGDADDLTDARRAVAQSAEDFRNSLDEWTRRVGAHAAQRLPERGTVFTLSSSSTVKAALLERVGRPGLRVVCLESRPMNEGRMLAEKLADAGLSVLYAVDAAASSLLPEADVVLLGADSIGDRGVVNKIGSAALVRLAREAGIPVIVTADRTKLLPPGFPQAVDDDRPADEVWKAPAGVRVWNRYFEAIPLSDVDVVVTEDGALSTEEITEMRKRLSVPEELRRWAREHEEPDPSSSV